MANILLKIKNLSKRNKILLTVVSIFLVFLIAFGTTLGIIVGLRDANALVKYEGVYADEGTVRYLASYYKYLYKSALATEGVTLRDTERFWASDAGDGKTHGERLSEGFSSYLSALAVANKLYSDYSREVSEDKDAVRRTAEEILDYSDADGSVEEFNRLASTYGFDYDDFLSALTLIYRAERAEELIYGRDGAKLASYPEECERYLGEYSHVALMFFRTEEKFLLDAEGNRTYDSEGNPKMRPLTDSERAELEASVAFLDEAIRRYENDEDGKMSETTFNIYFDKSDSDMTMREVGYYFHERAERTAEFATAFPEVVEAALAAEKYSYTKVECSIGICYIYKYDSAPGAYNNKENVFFSDFYSDAADYFFSESLTAFSPDVVFSDSYAELDITKIPINSQFIVRQWR